MVIKHSDLLSLPVKQCVKKSIEKIDSRPFCDQIIYQTSHHTRIPGNMKGELRILHAILASVIN